MTKDTSSDVSNIDTKNGTEAPGNKEGFVSLPMTSGRDSSAFPCGLGVVRFERPRVVFERGKPGTWDDYGVRDCCILTDEDGYMARDGAGALIMYYTGASAPDGMTQSIGRAVSFDEGLSWKRSPEHAVVAPRAGCWDSLMATTPWAVRCQDGRIRLYYRGLTTFLMDEACGLAVSNDGINFEQPDQPLFDRTAYHGMPQEGPVALGVYNIVRMLDGRWLLSWEANAKNYEGKACIFAATSDDGISFEPWKNGHPLFTPDDIKFFPASRVANPRITVLHDQGLYILAYNAHFDSGNWSIGIAISSDLEEWTDHPGNPLLSPSFEPIDDPCSGRIEGGVIVKEDLVKDDVSPLRCFLMAIPQQGPSMCGAVIALATGHRDGVLLSPAFRCISRHLDDAAVSRLDNNKEYLSLVRSAASKYPTRVHFTFPPDRSSISFSINTKGEISNFDIIISSEASREPQKPAIIISMFNNKFAVERIPINPDPPPRIRFRILAALGLYRLKPPPGKFIASLEKIYGKWVNITIQEEEKGLRVMFGDSSTFLPDEDRILSLSRDIGFVLKQGRVDIRDIQYNQLRIS